MESKDSEISSLNSVNQIAMQQIIPSKPAVAYSTTQYHPFLLVYRIDDLAANEPGSQPTRDGQQKTTVQRSKETETSASFNTIESWEEDDLNYDEEPPIYPENINMELPEDIINNDQGSFICCLDFSRQTKR